LPEKKSCPKSGKGEISNHLLLKFSRDLRDANPQQNST